MRVINKKTFIFLFIAFQTLLAISGGLLMLYYVTKDYIPKNVYIGKIEVGGLQKNQASKKLEDQVGKSLKTGNIILKINDSMDFKIKLSDIDASFDFANTFESFSKQTKNDALLNLINSNFVIKKQDVSPVIAFNEGKLRQKLSELSAIIDKEPQNANIYLKDDKVIKVPESLGLRLNIDNAIKKVKNELGQHIDSNIEFKSSNNFEIEVLTPFITSKKLEGADEVISKYSTDIKSADVEKSVKLGVDAINRVVLYPEDIIKGYEADTFSFNKYLAMENGIVESNNEGYNQVSSTLYAAVVQTGINQDAYSRTPHKTAVDYIEYGLDAIVFGNITDFKFKNTLDSTIVIFAELKDRTLTVSIVSKKKDSSLKKSFKFDIEQKIDPPITYIENRELETGQKRIITSGREGLKVKVYLLSTKNGIETNRILLSSDQYDPIEKLVQIGPNTKWEDNNIHIK